jgi:hypothetical protein
MRVLPGPILMIFDVSPENQVAGIGLTILLIAIALIALTGTRRGASPALVVILAVLAWLFLGIIGDGIGC